MEKVGTQNPNLEPFIARKMKRSSKASAQKSDKPRSGKDYRMHLFDIGRRRAIQEAVKDISAQRIQRAWLSYIDKTIFRLLKHALCAVEYCVTHQILKKVSPLEAELLKDPSMKYKVRFRFSGETFPPVIVFKIFLHNEGHGYKYFSGKNLFKPSNEGVADACKMMGKKKFYCQIMEDEHRFQKFKITDEIDIVTLKDYMQYSSLLDETPASSGGRSNYWRKLNLKNIPRTMIIYDIVDYAESGIISSRLQKEMKYLLQRPGTEEMRQHQLQIVSEVRRPSSFSAIKPLYRPYQQQNQIKHLGRRSKQAQMKVEKMKKAFKMAKEKNASKATEPQTDKRSTKQRQTVIFSTPSFNIVRIDELSPDEELEKQEEELFAWYQDLCINSSLSC
ncbi:putative uncharacterized protein CXorf58 homolog isoform X2 [Mustela erminea]|uniref:putative uncharacterized protein CXorf58 homolog isoform X2 n=1 Tax=Mustela erminea TaxID=36723 RepID=UPI00138700CA|nr:putative uncharacterized protein CXorf58 homolog isoform X2 [Mustela erminea]